MPRIGDTFVPFEYDRPSRDRTAHDSGDEDDGAWRKWIAWCPTEPTIILLDGNDLADVNSDITATAHRQSRSRRACTRSTS